MWDIRLWWVSKYVPYYSGDNLASVLGERYEHHPKFAPTFEMLTSFKDKQMTWADAEPIYRKTITERQPLANVSLDSLDHICLLCTEKNAVISIRYPFIDMVQKGCRQIWGPAFDRVLPQDVQEVLDLSALINEITDNIQI